MSTTIRSEIISLAELDEEEYFTLYRKVYGDTAPLNRRWRWEYKENPLTEAIRIVGARSEGKLVAATTRLPFDIAIEGQVHRAYFSVDSMVDPGFRRMGIMEQLYEKATHAMPLLYSKGAMPGMYKLLMKFGYRPVMPNTFLVCYLNPWKLIMKRMGRTVAYPGGLSRDVGEQLPKGFFATEKFSEEFDTFCRKTADAFPSRVVKDSRYMNWRYIDIPHKIYHCFYSKDMHGSITAAVVLGAGAGGIGKIVDIQWDPAISAEPARTIAFSKSYLRRLGFAKVLCWCSYQPLRARLKNKLFWDRGESPRFSVFSTSMDMGVLGDGGRCHFVDGDGDFDIL